MNYNIILFILGIILGYFIMIISSNVITYHGPNSNIIRNLVFIKNGKRYMFLPKLICI